MLEEQGEVVSTSDGEVWVDTIRQSSCASCSARKGCGQKLLSEIGQGQRFRVRASNPLNLSLQQGDRVVLGLAESSLLSASALIYLLPLAVLVLAAVVADQAGLAEPWVAAVGLGGLATGLLGVRRWGPKEGSGCRYHPRVLRKTS